MSQVNRSQLIRYGFSLLLIAMATLVVWLVPVFQTRQPFALYLASIILIGVYTGLAESLMATVLSAFIVAYFFLPPQYTLILGPDGVSRVGSFLFLALLFSFMIQKVKSAETTARLREEQMATTLLSIGDAVIVTDAQGRVTLTNHVAQALTGYSLEEARGKFITDVFHIVDEQTRAPSENPVAKVLSNGHVAGLANHTILIHKDGREIQIDDSGAPIKDQTGKITGVILVFRDISNLVKANKKLRFQAHLLDVVQQAVMATDNEGHITYWNRFSESLYGWKAEEVMGQDIVKVTPSTQSQEQAEEIMSQLQKGESWSGEILARHRDGSTFEIRVTDSPVYDELGKQIGIVGSSEDITERKRVEEISLRWAAIVESTSDAIFGKTLDGIITSWNKGAEQVYGYKADEIVGKSVSIIVPLERRNELEDILSKIRAGQRVDHLETMRVRKDGTRINVAVTISPIIHANGTIIGASTIARDITDRIRSEEMLRNSEERYRIVAETASEAIITIDHDSKIVFANRAAERIFGYSLDEIIGSDLSMLIPDFMGSRDQMGLTADLDGSDRKMSWDSVGLLGRHQNGREVPLELSFSEFMRDGKPNFTGIARDITERKMVEAQQAELLTREQAARSEAERANRTKDEFLATLSHELRTPLTAMLGWTWMLRARELDNETYLRAVDTIERNVRAQAQLIDDLLDVSRIITGKLRLEVVPADLAPVIEAAIDTARPAAAAKGIQLHTELDPTANRIVCDPARMQQVVWNLLSNAVKFTPKNGRVTVSLKRTDAEVEIGVSDTGPGIAEEFIPHVFDRFRQADSSTTRLHGGLGLGLAIVRHLVELHGGTVKVENRTDGQGTSFVVSLPLTNVPTAEADAVAESDRGSLPISTPLDGVRILVVDDDSDTRDLLVATLLRSGAEPMAVATADEAFDAIRNAPPDVLISDVGMPVEDGYMLMRKVRVLEEQNGSNHRIPAMALTAYVGEGARRTALEAGFHTHLAKPIEPASLIEAIADLLRPAGKA
jgi:PAS domain S-box-containing protein